MLLWSLISILRSTPDFNDFFKINVNMVDKRVRARSDSGWNIDQTLTVTA